MKLREKILRLLKDGEFKFKSYSSLFAALEKQLNEQVQDISSALNFLINNGEIYESNNHTLIKPENIGVFKGEIVGNAKGFAFVKSSGKEDYFIPAKSLMGALDGDVVLFKAHKDSAEVVKILKRANVRIVGIIVNSDNAKEKGFFVNKSAYSDFFFPDRKKTGFFRKYLKS